MANAQAPAALTTVLPAIIPSQTGISALGGSAVVGQVKTLALPAADLSQLSPSKTLSVQSSLPIVQTDEQTSFPLISGIIAASPFAKAVLSGKTSKETPATAKFLIDPASVAPDAKSLENSSNEGAHGLVGTAMSRILGVQDHSEQSSEAVPAGGNAGSFAAKLLPAADAAPALRPAVETPKPSFLGIAKKTAWTVAAAFSLWAPYEFLLKGLAASPASLVFQSFAGSLLFWGLLESIILHELGHAWTAEKVGDVTPRMAKQFSVNPLRFTGPIGASVLFLSSVLTGAPIGGFATYVQQDLDKVEHKAAMGKVALAGPAVNMALGALCTGLILGIKAFAPWLAAVPWVGGTLRMVAMTAFMNFLLGISNLIPLGPLDGQKCLMSFIPDKYHPIVRKITLYAGLALIAALCLYMLGAGGYTAATQAGAGTPIANTSDPFVMAITANGAALWLGAVWPAVKKYWDKAAQALRRHKILKAGGIALMLSVPTIIKPAPYGKRLPMKIAAPWSGDAEKGRTLSAGSYSYAQIQDLLKSGKDVASLSDGSARSADQALIADIHAGRAFLLQDKEDPSAADFFILPASALGGRGKTLLMNESAAVASMLGFGMKGRRLLTPEETRFVVGLSKSLKTPVYELAFTPDEHHPALARYAMTENGPAFFLRIDVMDSILNAPSELQGKLLLSLKAYMNLLRMIVGNADAPGDKGYSLLDAEHDFLRFAPELAAFARPS